MYTSHTILDLSIICIFEFAFKRTLIKFKFSFFPSRLTLSIQYRSFSSNSDSIIFCASIPSLTLLFYCSMISSTLLLAIALLYCCLVNLFLFFLIVPTVVSMPNFSVLRTKVSQDLVFIWWMPGAMDETCGFGLTLRMIYISFPALVSTLTRLWVSIRQGGFSSI